RMLAPRTRRPFPVRAPRPADRHAPRHGHLRPIATRRSDQPVGHATMRASHVVPMEASVEPAVAVAFNKAVDEHADALKNFASRMLNDQLLAEDIAQDTFLALFRNLHAVPVH